MEGGAHDAPTVSYEVPVRQGMGYSRRMELCDLTRQSFEPHLQTRFVLSNPSGDDVELELVEATDLPGHAEQRTPFSVLFTAPPPMLGQGTYRLQHDEMGAVDLFLVPIGADDAGVRYEAVFG